MSELNEKYDILNEEFVKNLYQYKSLKDNNILVSYSQYTIDHVNWMVVLFYRWIEKERILVEAK